MPSSKKLKVVALAVVLIALAVIFWFVSANSKKEIENDMGTIFINDRELKVKIADTNEERMRGLQNVTKLEGYDGMLFKFDISEPLSFWNKETLLDLDVVWIADGKVLEVTYLPRESKEGVKTINSPGPANMVLELPAGRARDLLITKDTSISAGARLQ